MGDEDAKKDVFEALDISKIDANVLNKSDDQEEVDPDEPPLFWTTHTKMGNEEDSFLQRMIADPNQILDDVMSPIPLTDEPLSDWDDVDNDKLASLSSDSLKTPKKIKKRKKRKKPKRKKDRHKQKKMKNDDDNDI